jgi:hypothetical protein
VVIDIVLALIVGIISGAIIMGGIIRFRKATGELVFSETEDGRTYTLRLEEEPEDLIKRRYILFRVSNRTH